MADVSRDSGTRGASLAAEVRAWYSLRDAQDCVSGRSVVMSRTHTLGSRVVAWVTASLLVIAPSSCTPQPTDDGSEHDAIEFRVGEPNPGALAGAVGFFRTLPVVLAACGGTRIESAATTRRGNHAVLA